jgi:phosphodiesterase/alkaline phosphatase D-like protein
VGRSPGYLAGAALAVVIAALLAPGSALAANGFRDGITAGEITAHSAIIWGQTKHPGRVDALVARGAHEVFARTLRAKKTADDTVQTKVRGLEPSQTYHYKFCRRRGGGCSPTGQFETAPTPSSNATIRFAYSGDETGAKAPGQQNPLWGRFKAFKSMAAEHNDFNIDFGDTIYSDPELHGTTASLQPTALSVKQKWRMYRLKLAVANMRKIRAAAGLYNHWDDHEFIDNFSIPENGRPLYKHSVKAFRDYEPVTFSKKKGIYRTFRWGKNLELFFLDERSFRSAEASANHVCDNPSTPGQRDLAPTAAPATRSFFSAIVPSFSQPVSQQCKDTINNPDRTFLGKPQLHRFLHDVKSSKAKWKVVMNEDPIQQFYADPYDRWEGYAFERVKLLKALQSSNVSHLVFLTTDTHAALQNVVRLRTRADDVAPSNAPAQPQDTPYQDFVIGPVGTKPYWQELDDTTGGSGNGMLISNFAFKPPPPQGVGMSCAQGGENSYAEVTVKRGKLKVAYKDENGNTVLDSDGTTPCGPYVLTH